MPYCCRKRDSFQDTRVGSCLTFGNELSKEMHKLTKQQTVLGRGTQAESRSSREPRRMICHVAPTHGF